MSSRIDKEKLRLKWWMGFSRATIVFTLLVGAVALALSIGAYRRSRFARCQTIYGHQNSGELLDWDCNSHVIVSTTPVDLLLPNDLSNYVGKTYSVFAKSPGAHTLSILPGTLVTRFGTTFTKATWIGTPNLVHFHVESPDQILVIFDAGINFSS